MMRNLELGDDEADLVADPENPNEYITYTDLPLRTLEKGRVPCAQNEQRYGTHNGG